MNPTRFTLAAALAALAAAARAQERPAAKASLGEDARQEVAITVYNNNHGLVRETRKGTLPKGVVELEFAGVAANLDPASVLFRSVTAPGEVALLEQNHRSDVMTVEKLMERNVGRKIAYIERRLASNSTVQNRREGILLSTIGGAVVKFADGIEINPPGTVVFDAAPGGLVSKPTLSWLVRNEHEGEQTLEASYMADDIDWKADYAAVIAADETKLDLNGWATVTNRSGASYRNAQLKLVAGEIQRAPIHPPGRAKMLAAERAAAPEAPMAEEGIFEGHLYTLGRRADLLDNETKQLGLLEGRGVAVKKIYSISSTPYDVPAPGKAPTPRNMAVALELANKKESGLGMPLPAGIVRAYKPDADGTLQIVGEDSIDHTPEGARLRVNLGEAFDVVAERTQVSAKRVGDSESEAVIKIVVKNAKKEAIAAAVIERFLGDWKITQESQKHFQTASDTIEYALDVPPGGEASVTFTVKINFMPTGGPPSRPGPSFSSN